MPRSRFIAVLLVVAALVGGVLLWTASPDGSPPGTLPPTRDPGPPPDPEALAEAEELLSRPLVPGDIFAQVSALAEELARLPWVADSTSVPPELTALGYDSYRDIEFRSEAAIWRDRSPFELQLFHPGFRYTRPVRIHIVEGEAVREVPFEPDRFDYGDPENPVAALARSMPAETGYAGFRIHYPLNDPASKDEILVFLGASYFRMLGPGQAHGLSSRGLAIDVAEPTPEEFPYFRSFWMEPPVSEAESLAFHALLDSPSVAGAYRFRLVPGEDTALEVTARLFARADIAGLGVAPLTSMFLHGDRPDRFDDFRPRVHDSDGLLMRTSWDEWIWRPLSNPEVRRVSSLRDGNPRGFGLVQRARDFEDYLDLEAQYHRRPSEWVTVEGSWGDGGVELVELPTPSEFNDNIVAYWAPDAPFLAGESREYSYRLGTFGSRLEAQTLGQVIRTLNGHDALPGQGEPPPAAHRRFVVDFRGGELGAIDSTDSIRPVLASSSGEASEPVLQPLPAGDGWRASFGIVPEGNEPVDMRLFLEVPGRRVTETWSYVWYPERVR